MGRQWERKNHMVMCALNSRSTYVFRHNISNGKEEEEEEEEGGRVQKNEVCYI